MTSQYFLRHSSTVVRIDVNNLDRGFVEQLEGHAIKRCSYEYE